MTKRPAHDPRIIPIFEAMLRLLATGHSKGAYARVKEKKPRPRDKGDAGGHRAGLDSPNAVHFSIVGAHLRACNDAGLPFDLECASRALLDRAAKQLRFIRNIPEANLEDWNDITTQDRIIKVVGEAITIAREGGEAPAAQRRQPALLV